MSKRLLLALLCTMIFAFGASAQVNISGTVVDAENDEPLPGVSVVVSETGQGDATGPQGEYEITGVQPGSYTLVATFIGYERFEQDIDVGDENLEINIEMAPDVIGLDDVVVTAFGIERERRALGYGTTGIDSEVMERNMDADVVRSLQGNLPGVNINEVGGISGAGTDINIRGFSSITGSNDPLFIVDGVRVDGGRHEATGQGWYYDGGAQTTPNRFLDIDPQNIKDIRILKGLSASVLYGEAGSDGVVLITTKSGSFDEEQPPGFQVTLNQRVHATQISSRPDYQDEYGIGFDQNFGWFYSNWGPRFDDTNPVLYGGDFRGIDDDGTVLITHPILTHGPTADAFPEYQDVDYRYEAKPDPMEAFFETGLASTTDLSLAGGFEDLRLNVSYSRTDESGYTPNNSLTRDNFGIGAQYRVSPSLFARTSFNMALTDMQTPPSAASFGSGSAYPSAFSDVFYTPRSIDINAIPWQHPVENYATYYRSGRDIPHPLWTANTNRITDQTNRYFGRTEFNYEAMEGMHLVYRLGYDGYNTTREYKVPPGGADPDWMDENGIYQTIDTESQSWDHNVNAIISRDFTPLVSFDATLGAQFQQERRVRSGVESQGQLIWGLFSHDNFTSASSSNSFGGNFQSAYETETFGVFGEMTFGYDDIVYLNVAGRNDWFSTLEPDNRSIFYPSTSISYIPSDHLNFGGDAVTYWKLYAGVGSSAGQPEPFSTRNTLSTNARAIIDPGGQVIATNATSGFLGNPDLLPELHTEYEVGTEVRFLDDRLGFDVTAYTRTTEDLITQAPLDPGTGFTSTLVNIGEVINEGIEVSANATPVLGDLRWDVDANLTASRSEVTELAEGLDRIQVGGGFTTLGNFAVVGEPFQVMYGSVIRRVTEEESTDPDNPLHGVDVGTPIIDAGSGGYQTEDEIGRIGNPNPDFIASMTNTLRFRGASLSFQFDYQHGGDMYSMWMSTLMARGLTESTTAIDRNNTLIIPGVNPDGSENNVQVTPSGAFFGNFGFGPQENRVYDMTHIRLQSVRLSYDLPAATVDALGLDRVSLSLTGNNLWVFAFNVPQDMGFDPRVESIGGNARGFEYLTGPAARRFGGSLTVQF